MPLVTIKLIEGVQVHRQIPHRMAGVVKPPLGDSPDQRHLPALEPYTDRAAGSCCLALAAAPARLAATAGLTLP